MQRCKSTLIDVIVDRSAYFVKLMFKLLSGFKPVAGFMFPLTLCNKGNSLYFVVGHIDFRDFPGV